MLVNTYCSYRQIDSLGEKDAPLSSHEGRDRREKGEGEASQERDKMRDRETDEWSGTYLHQRLLFKRENVFCMSEKGAPLDFRKSLEDFTARLLPFLLSSSFPKVKKVRKSMTRLSRRLLSDRVKLLFHFSFLWLLCTRFLSLPYFRCFSCDFDG